MRRSCHTDRMDRSFEGVATLKEVYFIGIGGIGMSALARFFRERGVRVSGYDKTSSELTDTMEAEGIPIHFVEDPLRVPQQPDRVVYTPAIPPEHRELIHYRQRGVPVLKRSEVLEIITTSSFNICIAGTHGKTTITSMVAHLLRDSGFGCNAFLGGISVNYGTNYWSHPRNVCVVEADEFDRSFLKLTPDVAVISAMDPDHLDVYGTAADMEAAFIEFAGRLRPGGLLIGKAGLKRTDALKAQPYLTYSATDPQADAYADAVRMEQGGYRFRLHCDGEVLDDLVLHMGGMHNLENAVAAVAVARYVGVSVAAIRDALAGYQGVKRRFEYVLRTERLVLIDDYAHHPEELRALIQGAHELFPGRRCTVLFQPHLFSRTRDHADGFAAVLDQADQVILLPIYPAREEPIAGVDSGMVLKRMRKAVVRIQTKEEVLDWAASVYRSELEQGPGLLIVAGAGDIDRLVAPLKTILEIA